MRSVDRTRIAVVSAVTVAAFAWVLPSLGAKPSPPLMAGGGLEKPKIPTVSFKGPVTPEAAAVWTSLQKKVPVKFKEEIPYRDFLKFVSEATATKDHPEGVAIYEVPLGLIHAEPGVAVITLPVGTMKLETVLRLALEQLDMEFSVHPDGIVVVTWKDARERGQTDSNARILDRIDALQKQVTELESLIAKSAKRH